MAHQFSQIPNAEIPRSSFDRSHGVKTTFDAGFLVPFYVDEALPGDTFNLKLTGFARLATPIFPIMDNMFMETFFFAVPNRLLWDKWERFNGAQADPNSSIDFTLPVIDAPGGGGIAVGGLFDYMGIPTGIDEIQFSALPGRAYNRIWDDWFRDQNLQDGPNLGTGDGPDGQGFYVTRRRGKRHDYFTSCLPWPQKGDAIPLPLGEKAPITGIGIRAGVGISSPLGLGTIETGGAEVDYVTGWSALTDDVQIAADQLDESSPFIFADLSQATAATINELRQAFQIQRLQERDARGGTRYTEIIRSHFGVTSPDARLQRAEYLGGGSTPVIITPVAQTSETQAASPQGNLSAFGTAALNNHGFTKSFTEHCTLIGLVNVRADLTYQQGLNRMWSRSTRFDFFWPALAQIGEQAVLNKEIFAANTPADDLVFGYQERYAEYRYKPSLITGLFRSAATGSLDAWHLSQDFETLPVLNNTFIQDTPPLDRVIAVTDEPHFLFDGYINLRCARPMPLYGVPGMIDHF